MGETGFFTREQVKGKARGPVSKKTALTAEQCHKLGLAGVANMNPAAITPHIPPSGSNKPAVYVLGEAPTRIDDENGKPFTGDIGEYLRGCLGNVSSATIRFNNVVRTFQPFREGNKADPKFDEIECYRPSLIDDIVKSRPSALITMGLVPTRWALGKIKAGIEDLRGRHFPALIGNHPLWVYPVIHPKQIMRGLKQQEAGEYSQIPGTEHAKYFERDLANVFSSLNNPPPQLLPKEKLSACIRVETANAVAVIQFLQKATKETSAIDLETNRFRPYLPNAKILTISITVASGTLAFPLHHPQAKWSKNELTQIEAALVAYLCSPAEKIAHNAPFDFEWLAYFYGTKILYGGLIHCTMGQAHILDERGSADGDELRRAASVKSLDFLCLLYFGFHLKSISTGRAAGLWFGQEIAGNEIAIDQNKLETTKVEDVCWYNGRDTKFTYAIFVEQRKRLQKANLWAAYLNFIPRIRAIVQSQLVGLPINAATVAKLQIQEQGELDRLDTVMRGLKAVQQFEQQTRQKYNPDSPQHNLKIFKEILNRPEITNEKGKDSTDKETLAQINHPLAKLLLEYRGHAKLKGTYLDRMLLTHPETRLFPDNRLHSEFKHCGTKTKRLSSDLQQFPKRDEKTRWIRGIVEAPPGHLMLCCDQGQLEFRGIGMASQDKTIIDSLFNDYDVHMVWAEKIALVYPQIVKNRHGDLGPKAMKNFRGELKTDVIFPWFYGATIYLAARSLDNMPVEILQPIRREFEETFKGVYAWQARTMEFYDKHGYAAALSGHRRHGPMSKNQVINTGVQGASSDIVVRAWENLCAKAHYENKPWLAPVLNIHDDLSFIVPFYAVESAVADIAWAMTNVNYPWVNVPLVVEISAGRTWYEQSKLGDFRSDKMAETTAKYLYPEFAWNGNG